MRVNVWKLYLLLVIGVAATYFLVETASLSKLVLHNGSGASAVLAVLYGIWCHTEKPAPTPVPQASGMDRSGRTHAAADVATSLLENA